MRLVLALILALAASGAAAQRYAPQEFDFSDLDSLGMVESVREVAISRDLHAFDPEVLEHRLRPETRDEAVIRLDGGELITVQSATPHLRPGQRVKVVVTESGTRVEKLEP